MSTGQGESATSPRRLEAIEKQRQALELRRAGATYEEIARAVGYGTSRSAAYKAVMSAIHRVLQEPAEAVLVLELQRLDKLQMAIWSKAMAGDEKAIGRVLEIMGRRARLLGIDQPRRIDITARIRELAGDAPVDPDDMLRAAERIVRDAQA